MESHHHHHHHHHRRLAEDARSPWGRVSVAIVLILLLIGGSATASYVFWRSSRMGALDRGSTIAQTSKGEVEYAEEGQGPPILILHGSPGGYDQGLAFGRELVSRGFHVIAVSRPGYLRTPLQTGATVADQATAMDALLGSLHVKKCSLLAIGEGAPCALELATAHPDTISRIALLSPVLPGTDRTFHGTLGRQIMRRLGGDFGAWCLDLTLRFAPAVAMGDLIGLGSSLPGQESRQEAKEAMMQPAQSAFLTSLIESVTPISNREAGVLNDNTQILGTRPIDPVSISLPLMALCGSADTSNATPRVRDQLAKVPGVILSVLPGMGPVLPVGKSAKQIWDHVAEFFGQSPVPVASASTSPIGGLDPSQSPPDHPPAPPQAAPVGQPPLPPPLEEGGSAKTRPNFVIILIDDMGYGDIEPFGSKLNRTPNLNRMASEGMKLTSFYCAPVCTASRAQLMTGCYSERIGMRGVLGPVSNFGLSTNELTIADLLKKQGYSTMIVGKWHLGDQPDFLPTRHGFDRYFGLPYSNDQGLRLDTNGVVVSPPLPLLDGTNVIEAPVNQDTLTERYTKEAVQYIRENKDHPFFLYLAHTAVHVPLHPGHAFLGKSKNGKYGDWVEESDWSVGQILDALRELHLETNTMVFYTSDNGPWLEQGKSGGTTGPLRGGKFTTWEGGVRLPGIAWWPGKIAPGSSSDLPLSEMDLLPTFNQLAGGKLPIDRMIDGKDIWPVLSDQSKESPHDCLFYFGCTFGPSATELEAVRSGPWKLVVGPQNVVNMDNRKLAETLPASMEAPRLYNLDMDPGEQKDIAAEHPEVVTRLKDCILAIKKELRTPGHQRRLGAVKNPVPLLKRTKFEYD